MESSRSLSIDFIKVIATIMVITLHLNVERVSAGFEYCHLAILAGVAIPLFFMVSGYLMAGKECSIKYCLYKIKNILLFTGIICLLYDITVYIFKGSFVPNFPACLMQGGVWWHFWYFGTMIIIYALLPLVSKIIHSKNLLLAIGVLGVISIVFWVLDMQMHLEKSHICQTLRLWYFLLYFLLGAYIRINDIRLSVPWYAVVLIMAGFYTSVRLIPFGGLEYHFGSPLCVLYALALFLFINSINIDGKIIPVLAELILPTYAFHVIILKKIIVAYICPTIEHVLPVGPVPFILELVISILFVFVISKLISFIPYYKKFFRL